MILTDPLGEEGDDEQRFVITLSPVFGVSPSQGTVLPGQKKVD